MEVFFRKLVDHCVHVVFPILGSVFTHSRVRKYGRSSFDGEPLWLAGQLQQVVVMEEADQCLRGKVESAFIGRGGPSGRLAEPSVLTYMAAVIG